jgi:hypothetical protein
MKKEKTISVALRLSMSTLKRVDQYARVWDSDSEAMGRASALRHLIESSLHDYEMTELRRAALRKSLPARREAIRAVYTKEAYRVEVLDLGAPSNNQCSTGQRFFDLEQAREHYDSLDVPQGKRKELQRRLAGKMRYEPIEIEAKR